MYRAMVVHESWVIREIIKEELRKCDCQVICTASSRLEASISFRLHRPDILFVDAMMNGNSGLRTIHDVLEIEPDAVVVAMVGVDGESAALHAVVSGARGLLMIPSQSDIFQHEVKTLLHDKQPGRPLSRSRSDLRQRFRSVIRMMSDWRLHRRATIQHP